MYRRTIEYICVIFAVFALIIGTLFWSAFSSENDSSKGKDEYAREYALSLAENHIQKKYGEFPAIIQVKEYFWNEESDKSGIRGYIFRTDSSAFIKVDFEGDTPVISDSMGYQSIEKDIEESIKNNTISGEYFVRVGRFEEDLISERYPNEEIQTLDYQWINYCGDKNEIKYSGDLSALKSLYVNIYFKNRSAGKEVVDTYLENLEEELSNFQVNAVVLNDQVYDEIKKQSATNIVTEYRLGENSQIETFLENYLAAKFVVTSFDVLESELCQLDEGIEVGFVNDSSENTKVEDFEMEVLKAEQISKIQGEYKVISDAYKIKYDDTDRCDLNIILDLGKICNESYNLENIYVAYMDKTELLNGNSGYVSAYSISTLEKIFQNGREHGSLSEYYFSLDNKLSIREISYQDKYIVILEKI